MVVLDQANEELARQAVDERRLPLSIGGVCE